MRSSDCLDRLYDSLVNDVSVTVAVAEDSEFTGVVLEQSESPDNQLEVLEGRDEQNRSVELDVKFSVDGSVMNIELFCGENREQVGVVESVVRE